MSLIDSATRPNGLAENAHNIYPILPYAMRLGVYCSLNPMPIEHVKASLVLAAAALLAGCASAPTPAPAPEIKGVGTIARLDPALDALVPKDAIIEKVAGSF